MSYGNHPTETGKDARTKVLCTGYEGNERVANKMGYKGAKFNFDTPPNASPELREAASKIKAAFEQFVALSDAKPDHPALVQMKREIEEMVNSCPTWRAG